MEEKLPVHLVYKKSLFVELVRLDNNFLYSMPNRNDKRWQIFAFEDTPKLRKDIAQLNGQEYVEGFNNEYL